MSASATAKPGPVAGTSRSGYDLFPLSLELLKRLADGLTPQERHVLLNRGTERAFSEGFVENQRDGVYACKLCGLPLFRSEAKFDSGTGWPSFFEPSDPEHVRYVADDSHGMFRTEIRCRRCDSHLGHVFVDGPNPTGLRYCLNSIAMSFFALGREPM